MNVEELQAACKERGMRAYGLTKDTLKHQLEQWLDLSLNHNVPESLLLLSRTLFMPENLDVTSKLAATIKTLPDTTATQATAYLAEGEGRMRNALRLEVIREEQKKIEEEERELEEAEKIRLEASMPSGTTGKEEVMTFNLPKEAPSLRKLLLEARGQVKKATVSHTGEVEAESDSSAQDDVEILQEEIPQSDPSDKKVAEISQEDLADLRAAIDNLKGEDSAQKRSILELKKELLDYEEDLNDLKFIQAKAHRYNLQESKGAKRLFAKVNRMLGNVDSLADTLQEKERAMAEHLIKVDHSEEEKEKVEENLVTIHELISAVSKLQKTPDSSKIEQIAAVLNRMDVDEDGTISLDMVTKVIEYIGTQYRGVNQKQIDHIVDMLQKEEMLDVEDNLEKMLRKPSGPKKPSPESPPPKSPPPSKNTKNKDSATEASRNNTTKDLTEGQREKQAKAMSHGKAKGDESGPGN